MRAILIVCAMTTLPAAALTVDEVNRMAARFVPVDMRVSIAHLDAGDRRALPKLVEAARVFDHLYMRQLWSGNQALYERATRDTSQLGRARAHYYWLNKGPWSELDGFMPFMAGAPLHKPPGANYYPEDLSRAEFEKWTAGLDGKTRELATGFYSVIRRNAQSKLEAIPYSTAYRPELTHCATLLREAAALTTNASLKRFLDLRARAFETNDYYASDVAWMDLDAPIDVTIGPYETYADELFGYKAAFEGYVNIRDEAETAKVKFFANHLQEVEDHLPIEPRYRNPKLGTAAPIRVVNQIVATGDGAHAVQTVAYNLPNDERIVAARGSKRVMLRNVQQAKFDHILRPIAQRVLERAALADVSFEEFFTHTLAHELSHGIGPNVIQVAGRQSSPRQELKELFGAIEEAKADVTGLFMLAYLGERKLAADNRRKLYTTYLASAFRSLRFGIKEAHGLATALELNYLLAKSAVVVNPSGTFAVVMKRMPDAIRDLTHDLLTIEATGDTVAAKRLLDQAKVTRPEVAKVIERLSGIPTDIEPVPVTAHELTNK